jgi:RNA polymerase sigma-B factor
MPKGTSASDRHSSDPAVTTSRADSRKKVSSHVPDKDETQQLFEAYKETRDPEIRERLVELHARLVRYIAYKFANRGEPLDDLVQVGSLALVKAIDRYDPSVGAAFTTYATPTIIGEIKRYFRDLAWTLRVPRSLQELRLAVNRASEQLTHSLGRIPTVHEIAELVGVTDEQVIEAEEFSTSYSLTSLDVEVDNGEDNKVSRLLDFMGQQDGGYGHVDDRIQLKKAIKALNPQQRAVIYLRFYAGLSQTACARRLGVSQMQVSRLQSQVLKRLKSLLEDRLAS